ncbi:transposase [Rhodococcus sp. LB1]|uniref:transposase n=1 Tax=Rhodococcus sp. LB1 TaxID=1807499 RepID=UPI0009ECE7E2
MRARPPASSASNTVAAAKLISETGIDMTRFRSSAHLVSWAKFCPQTHQSAGKSMSKPRAHPPPDRCRRRDGGDFGPSGTPRRERSAQGSAGGTPRWARANSVRSADVPAPIEGAVLETAA